MNLRPTAVAALVALATIAAACGQPAGSTPPSSTPPPMDPSMPGMDMGGSPSPSPSTGTSGTMPGMGGGNGLMVDEPVPTEGAVPATETMGLQPLPFRLTKDGATKVFELTAKPVFWKINADTQVTALTYNGTVPGPLIRVTEGDRIRVVFLGGRARCGSEARSIGPGATGGGVYIVLRCLLREK